MPVLPGRHHKPCSPEFPSDFFSSHCPPRCRTEAVPPLQQQTVSSPWLRHQQLAAGNCSLTVKIHQPGRTGKMNTACLGGEQSIVWTLLSLKLGHPGHFGFDTVQSSHIMTAGSNLR